jgi:hypothetical protein
MVEHAWCSFRDGRAGIEQGKNKYVGILEPHSGDNVQMEIITF